MDRGPHPRIQRTALVEGCRAARPLSFVVARDGSRRSVTVVPRYVAAAKEMKIGIAPLAPRQFGLFGATIPTEFGGLGLSAAAYSEIVALISETWMSLTGCGVAPIFQQA